MLLHQFAQRGLLRVGRSRHVLKKRTSSRTVSAGDRRARIEQSCRPAGGAIRGRDRMPESNGVVANDGCLPSGAYRLIVYGASMARRDVRKLPVGSCRNGQVPPQGGTGSGSAVPRIADVHSASGSLARSTASLTGPFQASLLPFSTASTGRYMPTPGGRITPTPDTPLRVDDGWGHIRSVTPRALASAHHRGTPTRYQVVRHPAQGHPPPGGMAPTAVRPRCQCIDRPCAALATRPPALPYSTRIFPGFMTRPGSSACFTARITASSAGVRLAPSHSRLCRPMPCSADTLPPNSATHS